MGIRTFSAPKWMIFIIDVLISVSATLIAYFLRFNFKIPHAELESLEIVIPFVFSVRAITFLIGRTYLGIIRYIGTSDVLRITTFVTIGTIIFCAANILNFKFFNKVFIIPFSIIIIDYLATTFLMIAYRVLVKLIYMDHQFKIPVRNYVIIFGAGESGVISKRTLDRDMASKYKILAFVDDNEKKKGRKIEGIPIYHTSQLESLLTDMQVDHLIISVQDLDPKRLNEITETCLKYNTKVLNVPPVSKWINGELSFKQIKSIRIEDLLGRNPIKLDIDLIEELYKNRRILVTGAAGSIGSGLVRQLLRFSPKSILLYDQAESPLYELEFELGKSGMLKNCEVIVGDIRNNNRMRKVFETFNPEIVFHAAAYKHVPLMEMNPSEAVMTNILGTKCLADIAHEFKVTKFVMISTDKAVNPTNVMGTSKRIAEMYVQSLDAHSSTNFITTRFGNVLGSNGSVIPLFKKQIESGGPITVTHPEVTRYFMTIEEACQLVLEAGAIGNGGEIFIFDMGESVKIVNLAKKMLQLSRLELGRDIQIVFTGLRPGEKLYEELLNDSENTIPTHHPQIMKAKVTGVDFNQLVMRIKEIIKMFDQQDNEQIVQLMKDIVPEYKSQNSTYEKLDIT